MSQGPIRKGFLHMTLVTDTRTAVLLLVFCSRPQVVMVVQRYTWSPPTRVKVLLPGANAVCCSSRGRSQTSMEKLERHRGRNPRVWVALSQLPGDCALVALMAGCVMEMALELPELIPHIPSCVAPLWPASFLVQKPLSRQWTRPALPQ